MLNVIKSAIRSGLRSMGYDVRRIPRIPTALGYTPAAYTLAAPALDPVWPLPRRAGGLSDQEIRDQFARFSLWHYAYEFEGGLSFLPRHINSNSLTRNAKRPLQRFRHFMPYLVEALGGTLGGKRILDIACNSGFWSIQCGLLGAEVVGFDARPELIDQANLLNSIVGMDNVNFQVLNIEEMKPETLGRFDAVLNLGILYHLPDPLGVLTATKAMTESVIVVDTQLWAVDEAVVHYNWEEPTDICDAVTAGIVGSPSEAALELMLKHIGVASVHKIPLSTTDMPSDYLKGHRATWLITV